MGLRKAMEFDVFDLRGQMRGFCRSETKLANEKRGNRSSVAGGLEIENSKFLAYGNVKKAGWRLQENYFQPSVF